MKPDPIIVDGEVKSPIDVFGESEAREAVAKALKI